MRVEKYNNSPNFGIRYTNKGSWNLKVLKTFESSNLLKEIDSKYPEAQVTYYKLNNARDLVNDEPISTLSMIIKLAENKIYHWNLSSHSQNIPETHLEKAIKELTLEDVERQAATGIKPLEMITVIKKSNPITRFFKNLFDKI